MSGDSAQEGQFFSALYIPKGEPTSDNTFARNRLFANYWEMASQFGSDVAGHLHRQRGIRLNNGPGGGFLFQQFFDDAPISQVLDAITAVAHVLGSKAPSRLANWLKAVEAIFRDHQLHYRVDLRGGVHYSPDAAFEGSRLSVLAALQRPRYAAVAAEVAKALGALDSRAADNKGAVKAIFEAAEILFRLMVNDPACLRLGTTEVDRYLSPVLVGLYSDEPTRRSAQLMLKSLKEWVAAAHFQRHGHPVEDPYQPPIELTLVLLNSGMGFIRWLAQIDGQAQSEE